MQKLFLKNKRYLAFILIIFVIEPSINSILNFWLQKLFNSTTVGVNRYVILRLLTIGFLLWMVKRLLTFSSGVLKARYICTAKRDIKFKIFENLLYGDSSDISSVASSGEYISLFTNDINLLEQRFLNQIISLISGVFSVIILGFSFVALNWKIAIGIFVVGILAALVPALFSKELNRKSLKYSKSVSKFTQKIKEYFIAYPTIKNYSIERVIASKFDKKNRETEEAKFEADYTLTLANNIGSLLSWFMQFAAVGIGLVLVANGEVLIGTVVAAQSFSSDLAGPLQDIIANVNGIRSVKDIVKRMEELSLQYCGPAVLSERQKSSELLNGDSDVTVDFQDLSLNVGKKTIIDQFSYTFESGKKYLVIGINGSGKSSVFKTLKKWFPDYSGNVYINKKDISKMSSVEINKIVSYLNEKVPLFSCSVRDNISLLRDCTQESLQSAAHRAQLKLDLNREVSDEGKNLSSGEQRRIEIARSLLQSTPVLIFDEVISTLDIETAYEIEKMALGFERKTVTLLRLS